LSAAKKWIGDNKIVAHPNILIAGQKIGRLAGARGEKTVGDRRDVMGVALCKDLFDFC
jgi:hypothetical protein